MSKKISGLTPASALTGTELVEVVQGDTNKRSTVESVSSHVLIDEDDFASDSATKAPSQQSTKAYVDAQIADTLIHAQATITAAQINNSFSSPVTLASAPANFIPVLIGPVFADKTFDTAAFATNTNCRVSVGGQTSASLSDTMTAGGDAHQLVDVTTGSNLNAYGGADPIVFRTLIGNPTGGGSSTVTIYFSYKLIPA